MLLTIPLNFESKDCRLSLKDHQNNVLFDVGLTNCPTNVESVLRLTHCEVKKNIFLTDTSNIYESAEFTSNNQSFSGIRINTSTITYGNTVVYDNGV